MGMEALKAINVCHAYGKGNNHCLVLKDFSLTVEAGEFVALMGPSGSGKSTFLHLAAGLIAPESGSITVGGQEVSAMGDRAASLFRRRHEGVIFQAFNLIESMTVAENVTLPARLDHLKPDHARTAELLSQVNLDGKERRRPAELSGGERQRVAIARALYAKPDLILADEPTGNLDTRSARTICDILRNLNESEHSAILLVTHDPMVAASATRVCFIKDGSVAADFATGHDAMEISRRYMEYYQ